jgi:hypothetical protein
MPILLFHTATSDLPRVPGDLVCYLDAVVELALQRSTWCHRDT